MIRLAEREQYGARESFESVSSPNCSTMWCAFEFHRPAKSPDDSGYAQRYVTNVAKSHLER